MAYLKNRSFTLKTVFLSECWQRRSSIFFTRSSTTLLTSSEKTATSRGRMMSCLSTLRILCQSSFSLEKNKKTNHNRRMTTDGKHWLKLLRNSRSAHMLLTVHSWSSWQKHDKKREGLKGSHAEMRPVERPLMSLYSFHDSMLALWGATPSARSTSATMSRSAMETTSWGPKRDLKIFPNIFLCFICWVTVTQIR